MNLHEYQGKEILNSFGVRIQRGIVASTPAEAVEAAKKLTEETGTGWHVIKAQVHAGGRGKGGGVKLAKNLDQVKSIADDILGMMLITPQRLLIRESTNWNTKLASRVGVICDDLHIKRHQLTPYRQTYISKTNNTNFFACRRVPYWFYPISISNFPIYIVKPTCKV